MAPRPPHRELVRFSVTPRFEIFYALRALGQASGRTASWRQAVQRSLPPTFSETVKRVAPRPMMWALLADTLRDAGPNPAFPDITAAIESLDDSAFQRAILGGVFRGEGTVDALLSGQQPLGDAASAEAASGNPLVPLLGLHPYRRSSSVSAAFARIISEPATYQSDLIQVLDQFWNSAFRDSWSQLEARMVRLAHFMEKALERSSLAEFAVEVKLPVKFDDRRKVATSLRGSTSFAYATLTEINIIPSAFNDTRTWGAYRDGADSVRLYFPVFEPGLLKENIDVDPELGFRALGDTTRYAMASYLARSPTTSVELAKAFGVSKPTISHHIHVLRAAGLLDEKVTGKGVELSVNRKAVEEISALAVEQMFSGSGTAVIRRSRHQSKAGKSGNKGRSHKPALGAAE